MKVMSRLQFTLGVNWTAILAGKWMRCLGVRDTSIEYLRNNSVYEFIPVYMIPIHLLVILIIS